MGSPLILLMHIQLRVLPDVAAVLRLSPLFRHRLVNLRSLNSRLVLPMLNRMRFLELIVSNGAEPGLVSPVLSLPLRYLNRENALTIARLLKLQSGEFGLVLGDVQFNLLSLFLVVHKLVTLFTRVSA